MKLGKTLYVVKRAEWRSWLSANHSKEKEIWLIYYRKSSGKPRILYNDAVEEALCFGWIDSQVKGIDSEKYAQRFSPRRRGSLLSEMNIQRIRKLISNGKMTKYGLDAVEGTIPAEKEFTIAPDILRALKADKSAWENFQKFPESYKRIRVAYLESRRKRGTLVKSLEYFVKMTAKNRRIGFVKEMIS